MIDQKEEQKVQKLSEPLKELVGGGKNAKYVRECTEIHLARRGIEKLAGFDLLVNLEVLDVSRNKLTYICGLENCFRMKRFYLNDNKIFTLRGKSLQNMRFLEILELTNNNLRDLQKVLKLLQHMRFLKQLELKGSPCCEEPDYRLHVIFKLPSLHVLDSHVVTDEERMKCRTMFGLDTTSSTIAFGVRAVPRPPPPPPMPLGGAVSQLESEIRLEIDDIKAARKAEIIPEITQVFGLTTEEASRKQRRGKSLPAPPGWPKEEEKAQVEEKKPDPKDSLVVGASGRPRARDYGVFLHMQQNITDPEPWVQDPNDPDYDPDYKPNVPLDHKRQAAFKEKKRQMAPVDVKVYQHLV